MARDQHRTCSPDKDSADAGRQQAAVEAVKILPKARLVVVGDRDRRDQGESRVDDDEGAVNHREGGKVEVALRMVSVD